MDLKHEDLKKVSLHKEHRDKVSLHEHSRKEHEHDKKLKGDLMGKEEPNEDMPSW